MLKDAVMATIAYYDGLDYPLTSVEVYSYLVSPQRLAREVSVVPEFKMSQIMTMLDELVKVGKLEQKLGFYMLKTRAPLVQGAPLSDLAELRIEREKIAAQKWRVLRRRAWWLQLAPWVRGIFVSGSMALGNTTNESDFDMLVIMQAGRLYAGRLLLSGLTSLMGARRTRYERVAPDKFCFNHFITSDSLHIKHESLYNAQTYAHLVPLIISRDLAGKFFAANIWINKYVYNFSPQLETVQREVRPSALLRAVAQSIEWLFDNFASWRIGNLFEKLARTYQQGRINSNPVTHASGGRVVATDTELEFHPRSFERTVLERYNSLARRYGFSHTEEKDSGLN